VVLNFRGPLGLNVLKRVGRDDGEADEEDIGLGVAQRTETIVVLLTSSIPEAQVDGLAINHHVRRVVVEHSGDVFAGERIGGVRDEKAGLTDRTITDNDALNTKPRRLKWKLS